MMKKRILLIILHLTMAVTLFTAPPGKADFLVSDIFVGNDQFIYIKMENLSPKGFTPGAAEQGKVFITLFINNLRRAEYKIKYIDKKLFLPRGKILFRTNFRIQKKLKIKVEINKFKVFPETNFHNNTLQKELTAKK